MKRLLRISPLTVVLAAVLIAGLAIAATPALRVNGLDLGDGSSLGVSGSGHIVIRNNAGTLQQSVNGGAYSAIGGGGGGGGGGGALPVRQTITSPNGSFAAGQDWTWTIPVWIPADATQVRMRIANRLATDGSSPMACTGIHWGIGTDGGSGTYSGSPQGTGTLNLNADGDDAIGSWVTPVRSGSGKILIAWTAPNGCTYTVEDVGGGYWNASSPASVNPLPAMTATPPGGYHPGFMVHVEYTTASAKRLVVWGDSISRGYGTNVSITSSFAWALGADHGVAVDIEGLIAVGLVRFVDDASPYLREQGQYNGAQVLIQAKVNDLGTPINLPAYQQYILQAVRNARAMGASRVLVSTPTPCLAYAADETVRQQMIAWTKTLPDGIDSAPDFDAAINNAGGGHPEAINPTYDSGDGCHPNNTGQGVLESTLFSAMP